jgi:AraC-like DNA-binding protein
VAVSRSVLAQRFKDVLHHSVQHEIVRARIEKIAQILRETNMTVAQIAYAMEFDEPSSLTRYFRKATGLTPRRYREQYSKLTS